ncbi:MAG: class I SAM-dependent methyltransferase, partial [Candidatus Brocadiia bacterium]|nr:class I SAM-dependent methyltransferase [Candidatus Brocadiia bacterium]
SSPHGHKIELRLGPALDTLKSLAGPFDLVFIDADKSPYVDYYERALDLLSERGIIAVDNVLLQGGVLDPRSDADRSMDAFNSHVAQDTRVRHVLLPIRDGIMLVSRNFDLP